MKKHCIQCDAVLHGRIDKKFCSPECRVQYHNILNREDNQFFARVNRLLRKNRKILRHLYLAKQKKMHLSELTRLGFRPDYCTSIYRNKKEDTYYFSYDYGILLLQKDYCAVVKRKEYLQ